MLCLRQRQGTFACYGKVKKMLRARRKRKGPGVGTVSQRIARDGAQELIRGTRAREGIWALQGAVMECGQASACVRQRAVLSRSPGGASRLPGGQFRAWCFSLAGLETPPLVQGLSKPQRQHVRQGHHGRSRERASP